MRGGLRYLSCVSSYTFTLGELGDGTDGGVQDKGQHVLDRACTHGSSNV